MDIGPNNLIKERIFSVCKQVVPLYIEKIDMTKNFIESKKENMHVKRGRGRPRKYPIIRSNMVSDKIKKIDEYFKNGIKLAEEKKVLLSPNKIIEETGISDHSNKHSIKEEDECVNKTYFKLNPENNDENEIFTANIDIDKPLKIIDFKDISGEISFKVEWDIRSNGIYPQNSYVPNEVFKEYFPNFNVEYLNKFKF